MRNKFCSNGRLTARDALPVAGLVVMRDWQLLSHCGAFLCKVDRAYFQKTAYCFIKKLPLINAIIKGKIYFFYLKFMKLPQ